MGTHRARPWKVEVFWDSNYNPYYKLAGDVAHDGSVDVRAEHEANARLMSAAPKLLEAIENISTLDETKRLALIAWAKGQS